MRRLRGQFYLAILAALAVFLVASAIFWILSGQGRSERWGADAAARLAQGLLVLPSASAAEQQQAIDELQRRLQVNLVLYDQAGRVIASTASAPRISQRRLSRAGWTMTRIGPVWILPLEDGRRLVVQHPHPDRRAGLHLFILPVSLVLAFALGAYPIARRLTRRLEHLQSGVEQLGRGDLAARVAVEGRDEVAALARSFNQSAERIEELVRTHKLLLANCSHELRTPLARMRLGIERLASGPDAATYAELARGIAELDTLIEEMLLASRLDALRTLERSEEVDLLALAAEEAAHFDRSVEGEPSTVRGDAALLRRMIRNLLENALRHGGGATRVYVSPLPPGATSASSTEPAVTDIGDESSRTGIGPARVQLIVEDRGAGVAEADRERIFEPFYRGAARSARGGFGLGLAIVRQIARAHGGDVTYAPLDGSGSRFTVKLG